jgi:glycosyltransferase involved in cell wall biosynthesis
MSGAASVLSVIAPVHNSRTHVSELLQRIAPLVDRGCEVILVDDGSSDGTTDVLAAFAADHPALVFIPCPTAGGVARARNLGLAAATRDYVWFVDDDDLWDPGIVDRFLEAADHSGADIVICRADLRYAKDKPGRIIDGLDAERVVGRESAWDLLLEGALNGYLWNKLFRRTVLGDDPFDLLSSQSDFTGVARAVSRSRRIQFIPDVLYFHVVREGSITRKKDPKLGNLRDAHALARRIHSSEFGRDPRSADFDNFTAWFLILPSGRTPTRVRAEWTVRLDGVKRAREAAAGLDLPALRSRAPRLHRDVWLITRVGIPYLVALHLGQIGRRWIRKVGSR